MCQFEIVQWFYLISISARPFIDNKIQYSIIIIILEQLLVLSVFKSELT